MSVLLTIEAAAEELGCGTLAVKRLIARGSLRASTVGEAVRILPGALQQYVAEFAPDFQSSPRNFDEILKQTDGAAGTYAALRDYLRSQAATYEPQAVAELAVEQGVSKDVNPVVTDTVSVAALMDRPLGGSPLKTAGNLLLGERLVKHLKRVFDAQKADPSKPIERLYASQDQYDAAIEQALDSVLSGTDFEERRVSSKRDPDITLRVQAATREWANQARIRYVLTVLL